MRALAWHGKENLRCGTVLEYPRDANVKVTSWAICGSDFHRSYNLVAAMLPGDSRGHAAIGKVVGAGSAEIGKLKARDRVVIPFTVICGECEECRRGNFSACEQTNRKRSLVDKGFDHTATIRLAHHRVSGSKRDYSDRSGVLCSVQALRGLARKHFSRPTAYRAQGAWRPRFPPRRSTRLAFI